MRFSLKKIVHVDRVAGFGMPQAGMEAVSAFIVDFKVPLNGDFPASFHAAYKE